MGPPKCASTSLFYYLNQHNDVFLSPLKETHFFSINYNRGLDWFLDKYFNNAKDERIIGESTPTYSYLGYSLLRINKFFPKAKLLYSFRNPVERAYSAWLMRIQQGTETLSFEKALEANLEQRKNMISFYDINFESMWVKESKHIDKKNKLKIRSYIEAGLYSEMIEFAYSIFNNEQIKVVFLEDLKLDTETTIASIFKFLGVNDNFKIDLSEQNVYKVHSLATLYNFFGRKNVRKFGSFVPKGFKNAGKRVLVKAAAKPRITEDQKRFAYQYFMDDIEKLEIIMKRPLAHWKY